MSNPTSKAKWILETHGISGIPAMFLETIAKNENIKCVFMDFPDDEWLAGMLLYREEKRKIIVNTLIDNIGRTNFTLAHELGHYFLGHPPSYSQDGQFGFRCTSEDIENDLKPREVEANRFAVELLMPEDSFRLDMAGAPIDFELINSLSKNYMVSKHVCSNRIAFLTQAPCVIIRTSGINITSIAVSRSAKGFLRTMKTLPSDTIAYIAVTENLWRNDFAVIEAEKWLCRRIPSEYVYECTHMHRDSGTAMTIIKW
jgi:Zn-dependent peptidase ImmA (M78 family)